MKRIVGATGRSLFKRIWESVKTTLGKRND